MPLEQRSAQWDIYAVWWGRVYALLVFLLCVASIYTLSVSLWRGPWRDMWEVMPFLEKALTGEAGWQDYWEQYGLSHRPLISKGLWVADLKWFAGSNHLLLAVSLFAQAIIFGVVYAFLRRDDSFISWQRSTVLWCCAFCLLSITQVFNFLHTFDVQWFLVTSSCMLSLACLLLPKNKTNIYLVSGWLLVFFASLNNFSGLVMWPVEVLLLVSLRYPSRSIAIFFLAVVAYLPLYFYQLVPDDNAVPVYMQLSVWQWMYFGTLVLFKFPVWYLSNPLSYQLSVDGPLYASTWLSWLAPSVVGCLLLVVARHWYLGLLGKRKYSSIAWLGLSLILFGYGVGIVTAIGRVFFWENVYALRYQNIVLLFWIGVVLWFAADIRWRNAKVVVGSLLLLLIFTVQIGWYHNLILKMGNRSRDAHLALVVGLENQFSAIKATVSRSHLTKDSTYTLQHEVAFLRERHAGAFADPAWSHFPALETLRLSSACSVPVVDRDVHGGDESYARLLLRFREPVSYDAIIWYDNSATSPGLLIPAAADTWWQRITQSMYGFTEYAGFAKKMPQQEPEAVFARTGERWCKVSFSS